MLCHQLGRLVKIESNTHTKPLLNVSGDLFLLIDAHESANTLIDNKRRNKSSCRTYLTLCKRLGSSTQGSSSSCFRATRDFFVPFFFFSRQVYCDMTCDHGWTLVARFSNSDTLHWMKDSGLQWYDKNVASGETLPEIRVLSFMRYFYSCGLSKVYKAYSVGSDCQNRMAHSSGRCERVDYVALYNLSSVNLETPLKKRNNN